MDFRAAACGKDVRDNRGNRIKTHHRESFEGFQDRRLHHVIVTEELSSQVHLILPAGTQVVTRIEIKDPVGHILAPRGAVGEIVKAPDDGSHSYRVRFANAVEAALRRHEMTIRKQYQREAAQPGDEILAEYDLYD